MKRWVGRGRGLGASGMPAVWGGRLELDSCDGFLCMYILWLFYSYSSNLPIYLPTLPTQPCTLSSVYVDSRVVL